MRLFGLKLRGSGKRVWRRHTWRDRKNFLRSGRVPSKYSRGYKSFFRY